MEDQFKNWMISKGYSETGAVNSYSGAIHQISVHYSNNTGESIDIYALQDQKRISEIQHDYSQSGKFSDFGYGQHSRFRAAISRYSEFFVEQNYNEDDTEIATVNDENTLIEDNDLQANFAYERDLQTTLCSQISELFPDYRIFGTAYEGIEYAIDKKG